jgi:hypothetical protein
MGGVLTTAVCSCEGAFLVKAAAESGWPIRIGQPEAWGWLPSSRAL